MKAILATLGKGILAIGNKLPLAGTLAAKEDMQWFKKNTTGCSLVMGMRTWETLGKKPLKNRGIHYIITSKEVENEPYSQVRYMNMERFLSILPSIDKENLWCIGGASIYEQLIPLCSEVYWNEYHPTGAATVINGNVKTVTPLDEQIWEKFSMPSDIQGFTKNIYKKKN